ncbi:dienelactone hydrolase family protein [Pseudorhodoplanes sinuspersici]|nr:dienelactone hydrolase family protein [Pseudorhodoplanes sinuspersici]RKE70990.1 dienelactone hydrolase [Pseudorhodoplanes sinuspersici]
MRFIFLITTLLCLCGVARAEFEQIQIPTDNKPLQAVLYRPPGEGPFPVIVALAGCEGLRKESGTIRATWDEWGQRLSAAGFGVLFPDSEASRSQSPQCRDKLPHRDKGAKVSPDRERVADVRAARDWLQQQAFARKDRIALLGWDSGAIAVLWAVRPNVEPDDDRPDFRSAAVFYPGCQRLNDTAWSARVPTLILIGALDDLTPAKTCEQMVAGARGRSAGAVIVKYRGARHAFDRDLLRVRHKSGKSVPWKEPGRAARNANAEARADALKRIPEWFAR